MFLKQITLCSFCLFIIINTYAQTESTNYHNDTTYTLIGDTIFTNKDFKIFVGQKIIIGEGSDEREWYNSISFKTGLAYPLLFFKKTETEQDIEYQADPTIREKDKVRDYLHPGDSLTVSKIKRYGKKRFGYWYEVILSEKQGALSLKFRCTLISALRSKEILLERM